MRKLYEYHSLNESWSSRFLEVNAAKDKQFMRAMKALLSKGYDFTRIPQDSIQEVSAEEAYKLKGEKGDAYFKLWFDINNKFAFCTWANSLLDDSFNYDSRKRNGSIGNYKYTVEWEKNQSTQKALISSSLGNVYMIPYSEMESLKKLQNQRKEAKQNATALLKNRDIKKNNLEKYKQLIAKNSWTDGSEFDIVLNLKNPFNRYISSNGPGAFLLEYRSNLSSIVNSFIDALNEEIKGLMEYGFVIDDIPKEKRNYFFKNPKDFTKRIQEISKTSNGYYNTINNSIEKCANNSKEYQDMKNGMIELYSNNEKSKSQTKDIVIMLEAFEQMCSKIQNDLPNIINNIFLNSEIDLSTLSIINDLIDKTGRLIEDNVRDLNFMHKDYTIEGVYTPMKKATAFKQVIAYLKMIKALN